jgi:hypothetical protein
LLQEAQKAGNIFRTVEQLKLLFPAVRDRKASHKARKQGHVPVLSSSGTNARMIGTARRISNIYGSSDSPHSVARFDRK